MHGSADCRRGRQRGGMGTWGGILQGCYQQLRVVTFTCDEVCPECVMCRRQGGGVDGRHAALGVHPQGTVKQGGDRTTRWEQQAQHQDRTTRLTLWSLLSEGLVLLGQQLLDGGSHVSRVDVAAPSTHDLTLTVEQELLLVDESGEGNDAQHDTRVDMFEQQRWKGCLPRV
jgi:hypothetical protein